MSSNEASGELYILELGKKELAWHKGSEICKGKPPLPRFDHTMEMLKYNLIVIGGRDLRQFHNSVHMLSV